MNQDDSRTRYTPSFTEGDDDRDVVDLLADEFVARLRRGESPSIDEYADRCPDRADEVRAIFPTIAAMEKNKPHPTAALPSDGVVGDCRLVREIGRGGMGVVYEAEQESLGRRVAVKLLPRTHGTDDRPLRRFLREARTAARLHHPHIVPIHTIGEQGGQPYFVMTLVPGVGLDRVLQRIRRSGARGTDGPSFADDYVDTLAYSLRSGHFSSASGSGPSNRAEARSPRTGLSRPNDTNQLGPSYWRAIARVGLAAAEALQYAHEQGVLHRDIKPGNVLLDASGGVWVADFGLAKALGDEDLSRTGDLVGTLRYMAPERFRGSADARSDVYSLGLTLYEALTLRPAFDSADRVKLLKRIADSRPPALRTLNPNVPRDLETIVLRSTEPDPALRYPTAGDFANDLRAFLEGRPVGPRPSSARRLLSLARRHPLVSVLAVSTFILTIIAGYFIRLYVNAPIRPPFPPEGPHPFEPMGDRPPPKRGPRD